MFSNPSENIAKEFNAASKLISVKNPGLNSYVEIYTFVVGARDWIKVSETEKRVTIKLNSITPGIIEKGSVLVFIDENEKQICLPFTYYQSCSTAVFQSSYELQNLTISVRGSFILNTSVHYCFKILIINSKGMRRIKKINADDFTAIKKTLNFK